MDAATLQAMGEAPAGHYTSGEGWLHFCAPEPLELWGVVLWGRPSRDATAAMVRSLALELGPPAGPHASLVDTRALESVDVDAFQGLSAYVGDNQGALAEQVRRLALVRGSGLEGAVVAGFFEVLPRPYPVEVFSSVEEALGWLSVPRSFAGELDAVVARVRSLSPLVEALRRHLEAHLEGPAIGAAAKALGMSDRTLQRRLKAEGTSFVDQVAQARLRVAQRLLRDSDAPVTAIALDVGCSSPQHFAALFRRLAGESPSAWRARQREP